MSNDKSFIILRSEEGLTSVNKELNNRVYFPNEKSKIKLSGISIF